MLWLVWLSDQQRGGALRFRRGCRWAEEKCRRGQVFGLPLCMCIGVANGFDVSGGEVLSGLGGPRDGVTEVLQ